HPFRGTDPVRGGVSGNRKEFTMKNLNRQYVLNKVYRHFITEGHPAGVNAQGMPRYHGTRQGRYCPCAIGLFDKKKLLLRLDGDQFFDNFSDIVSIADNEPNLIERIFDIDDYSEVDVQFLNFLQRAHDRSVTLTNDFVSALIREIKE